MKLLLRHEYDDDRVAFLRQHLSGDWEISTLPDPVDPSTLAAALASADAVVCMSWDARTPAAHALRLLQLPGAGFDEVDFAAVPRHCAVCNVFEHEIGIAEYLLLAILEWEIRLCRMDRELRAGRWRGSFVDNAPLHGELLGKSVGFVGYGRIAREAAQRLKAFGVRVLARTRSPSRSDRNVDDIAGIDRLDEMLEASDYVVVSCPLSDATRGIIDAAALSALGPDGVIINVARGPVIDEDALWAACRERRIAGAIIDTWYRYPEPGEHEAMPSRHPFHRLDNVIMTPHASAWSAGLLDRRWRVIADNLRRLARGAELRNVLKAPG